MTISERLKNISKKTFLIIAGILISLAIVIFIWQGKKYSIVRDTLKSSVAKQSDSLYSVKYDSLSFDGVSGYATLKNVSISPDTQRLKNMNQEDRPNFLFDIRIKAISVTGVKTAKALLGKELVGDSLILDHPLITIYNLQKVKKDSKINSQTEEFYKQVLGNLGLIKANTVLVNNVNIHGLDFTTKQKTFDAVNANFQLEDLAIDSVSNLDTNRILFSRQLAFTLDTFFNYNNNRKQLIVKKIAFSGKYNTLLFDEINVNRFADQAGDPIKFVDAKLLKLSGVNTNEIIKNKNMVVDTILCKQITYYQAPPANKPGEKKKSISNDSTGFVNVYGVAMKHLEFGEVKVVPFKKNNVDVGNISIKVNGVKSDNIRLLTDDPIKYSDEIAIAVNKLSLKSKDNKYNYNFGNAVINSKSKELKIDRFSIIPYTGEKQFAAKEMFQQDRYDVVISGIALKGIEMQNLLNNRIEATELVINNTSANIYRDLQKPLKKESKVGNYPSQVIQKLDMPIHIQKATLLNADMDYKEREKVSDSVGIISFTGARLDISNITNIPSDIKKNNELNVAFSANALGSVPLKGNMKFFMDSKNGDFVVDGKGSVGFEATKLNKVSIPMALIKIKSGKINSMDFHITGNNTSAKGTFVMKYDDFKVDVLKKDKNTGDVKKKGLISFVANTIVKNSNPQNGKLREETPSYERDIYKSFFNLIWKTIFTGMKTTLGIPDI
ncbi:MAG: hypothetical protein ABI266_06220 [Ginsengibacter sp.]